MKVIWINIRIWDKIFDDIIVPTFLVKCGEPLKNVTIGKHFLRKDNAFKH